MSNLSDMFKDSKSLTLKTLRTVLRVEWALKNTLMLTLSLTLILLFTSSCSNFTSQSIKSDPSIESTPLVIERTNAYQIGRKWNRSLISLENHWVKNQVFRLYRLFQSDVGVGVYLGEFANQHLMLTANHNFPDLDLCDEDINFTMTNKGKANTTTALKSFLDPSKAML